MFLSSRRINLEVLRLKVRLLAINNCIALGRIASAPEWKEKKQQLQIATDCYKLLQIATVTTTQKFWTVVKYVKHC